jgi:hypothetical protein
VAILAALIAFAPHPAHALIAEVSCPGGVTYAGECKEATLQWCENGEVIQIDCAEQGSVCAWSDSKEFYTCMEADPVQTECELYGALTWEGECVDASTLVWCSNDAIETLECKEGMVCGWDASSGEYNCMSDKLDLGTGVGDGDGGGSSAGEEGSEPATPQQSPAGSDDEDIAEQAQVIRGSAPKSDSNEDDGPLNFFAENEEAEPLSGCSGTSGFPNALFPMGMFVLLWLRSRRPALR